MTKENKHGYSFIQAYVLDLFVIYVEPIIKQIRHHLNDQIENVHSYMNEYGVKIDQLIN